jgi:redox-sensitive bicupin YhaK (pirin superfamily)
MISHIPGSTRGAVDFGWLKSWHSFSFGEYYNPSRMGFSTLRVINDDRIKGGTGFPAHSHREMEIITFMIAGVIQHQDSTGGKGETKAGEIQVMTAGTGITHSEFAGLESEVELFQIWIQPDQRGYKPEYRQFSWVNLVETGNLKPTGGNLSGELRGFSLLASKAGLHQSIKLNADAALYYCKMSGSQAVKLNQSRKFYIQMISGEIHLAKTFLKERDAAEITNETELEIRGDGIFLMFDLP